MKKMLALLLAAVMCLSLVACGGSEENTAKIAEYESRIAELEAMLAERDAEIERLLAENESEVPQNTEQENTEPENTEPQYETVELTLENWNEYFEITNELHFCRNEFDEIWRIDNRFYLKLKPEYEERCVGSDDEFAIKIEWTETTSVNARINYEEETCELLEEPKSTDGNKTRYAQVVDNIGDFKTSIFHKSKVTEKPGYFLHYPYDFEVTKIKGLLYIAKESE